MTGPKLAVTGTYGQLASKQLAGVALILFGLLTYPWSPRAACMLSEQIGCMHDTVSSIFPLQIIA